MILRKEKCYGTILILASLIVSISVAELFLRLISSDQYYVWPPGLRKIFRPVPEVMPGIEGESRFYINDHGLRGDPFATNQTYNILALGGSTTECLYLDEMEAWPYVLQEALNQQVGTKQRIWVGNAGKSGHNTRNHILQVERLTRQYSGINAVLLLIGVNDFLLRLQQDTEYRPFPGVEKLSSIEYKSLINHSFSIWPGTNPHDPFFKRTELWRKLRVIKKQYFSSLNIGMIQDDTGKIYMKWRMHRREASIIRPALPDLTSALKEYRSNINRIIRYTKSKGIRVVFVTQPYIWRSVLSKEEQSLLWTGGIGKFQDEMGHEYYSIEALATGLKMYNEMLLTICHTENAECIDLDSQLPKDMSVFYDDVHFNESGSREVANVLGKYLGHNMRSALQ